MVGILRKELRDRTKTERSMRYFKETRGWGEEADRWLGEGMLAGWRIPSSVFFFNVFIFLNFSIF